jgi:uncharacterized metal-binding protein
VPSGKVHDKITLAAAGLSIPVWWYFSATPRDLSAGGVLILSMLFSGLAISPDLDLNSSVYKRWGVFRYLWWPYQRLVPHRSWISHSFLLGPLLRVAYFLVAVWGLFRACSWIVDRFLVPVDRNTLSREWTAAILDFWRTHPRHLEMLLLGLFLGAFLHCAADLCVTAFKRRF